MFISYFLKGGAVFAGHFLAQVEISKGFLPSSMEIQANLSNGPTRPFGTLSYDLYAAGKGAGAVLAQDMRWGAGVEYVTQDGWGLGVGADWMLFNLSQSPNLADQSSIQTLMGQVFPNGNFYFQFTKYFPFHI